MTVETERDIDGLRRVGRIVALTVREMQRHVRPGITTAELDAIGDAYLRRHGARAAPRLTYGFPGAACISINDEAAHGLPGDRVIQAGDLVNIDVSAELDGYFADTGASMPVPPVSSAQQKLCNYTRRALRKMLSTARSGQQLNAPGRAAESAARRGGYRTINELHGHGVGRALHEAPYQIPGYYDPRERRRLTEGLVITLEPFLTPGNGRIAEDDNGWTIRTVDGSLAAQYEHTVIITRKEPIVVTAL